MSNSYTYLFQLLEVEQESHDGVSQDVWKVEMPDVKLSIKPNTQDIPSASDTAQTTNSEEPFHSPDLTQIDIVGNPDLVPVY